jgi:NAD(P)-dependent dehydrogenase (short-subunit alcohol dehydrogenase family)
MTIDLTNQVALVTGSAHRVGRAIALELARGGAHIMVHYHSSPPETVRSTVQDIKSMGVDAYAVQADVSTPGAFGNGGNYTLSPHPLTPSPPLRDAAQNSGRENAAPLDSLRP